MLWQIAADNLNGHDAGITELSQASIPGTKYNK